MKGTDRFHCRYEELRAVRILSGVRHGQDAFSVVLDLERLVLKPTPVDALATGSRSRCEVSLAVTSSTHPLLPAP